MKVLRSFLCVAIALFVGMGLVLAQDGEAETTIDQELKDLDVQWVSGEVAKIDLKNNGVIIRSLNYEDDQWKDVLIGVEAGTTYENIKSLDEVKPQDFLSIDYVVTSDGKNLAKNIVLDKSKESQAVAQPEEAAVAQPEEAAVAQPEEAAVAQPEEAAVAQPEEENQILKSGQ